MNAGITFDKTHNNYKVGLYVKEIGKYRYFTTANTEQEALELRNEMLSRKTKSLQRIRCVMRKDS